MYEVGDGVYFVPTRMLFPGAKQNSLVRDTWVMVEMDDEGDLNMVDVDEETLTESENEYVEELAEKGKITEEDRRKILD